MPNKAVAAGGTTALAGAITTLVVSLFWHSAGPEVTGALTTLIAAVLSAVTTYLVPHEGPKP